MTFAACRDAQHTTPRHNHTMKKTKTLTNEERIKRIRAMSQDKFDSKIAGLLAEAAAATMAVQMMLEERKANA